MRRTNCILVLLASLIIASASSTLAQKNDLEGDWVTVDERTRGITSLSVRRGVTGWDLEVWGKCHPTNCYWGSTKIAVIGESVEDHSFNKAFGIWITDFADKYMTLSLDGDSLTVQTITLFKDRSRRANYKSIETMKRAERPNLN